MSRIMQGRESFWSGFAHACLPLAIWAGHFFASYVFVAVGCRAGLDTRTVLGIPLLSLGLMAATLLALAALAWVLLHPGRARTAASSSKDAVATSFRRGAAGLSLVAVAWTAVPVLLLRSCLQ